MNNLTEEQKRAVEHGTGPACVIAGAGTGKTTALSERIVYLVEKRRIDPGRILATTFTRKATAELYDRVYRRLGECAQRIRMSTIDAFIWDLSVQIANLGFMRSARLLDEAQRRVLLLQCAWEEIGCEPRSNWFYRAALSGLVSLLERCLRAHFADRSERRVIEKSIRSELKAKEMFMKVPSPRNLDSAVGAYLNALERQGATDFNALSADLWGCLKSHKKLTKDIAAQFDAIVVDEFQDTSRVQTEILLLLAGRKRNIWVVGDRCQQIYEWRGAGQDNLVSFVKRTHAKKYYFTENWRSRQPILDCAYRFLNRRVPGLRKNSMLKPLIAKRAQSDASGGDHPVYAGSLEQAMSLVNKFVDEFFVLELGDIAILSRKLDKRTIEEIRNLADAYNLPVQLHSSRADRAMEQTLGEPPHWPAGQTLRSLYGHRAVKDAVSRSLRMKEFEELRAMRPLATAADALDTTGIQSGLTFSEAWPALKATTDREVPVSAAIVGKRDAIQVMTIHAAKGLEFPVVVLMKLGKGTKRSFPNQKNFEDSRLVYVGATRARDALIIAHTKDKPKRTLLDFGRGIVTLRRNGRLGACSVIEAPALSFAPPIIAATDLDLYEQCPLKFAAHHEGRFLPEWNLTQSSGARIHKAIEYYLRAGMPEDRRTIDLCLEQGFSDGDWPSRALPASHKAKMKVSYLSLVQNLLKTSRGSLLVEHRYRYLHGDNGQIDGVVDAVIERRDGTVALCEWKASKDTPLAKRRQYGLQARAGALGIAANDGIAVQKVEVIPISNPENSITFDNDDPFVTESAQLLERVFKDVRDRNYNPKRGRHCRYCQLKVHCPAQT